MRRRKKKKREKNSGSDSDERDLAFYILYTSLDIRGERKSKGRREREDEYIRDGRRKAERTRQKETWIKKKSRKKRRKEKRSVLKKKKKIAPSIHPSTHPPIHPWMGMGFTATLWVGITSFWEKGI